MPIWNEFYWTSLLTHPSLSIHLFQGISKYSPAEIPTDFRFPVLTVKLNWRKCLNPCLNSLVKYWPNSSSLMFSIRRFSLRISSCTAISFLQLVLVWVFNHHSSKHFYLWWNSKIFNRFLNSFFCHKFVFFLCWLANHFIIWFILLCNFNNFFFNLFGKCSIMYFLNISNVYF